MNSRKRKIILIVAALILLPLLVAAVALAYFLPRLHDELELALSEQTGRQVRLEKLSWAVWPRVAVRGQGLTVSDEGEKPLAEVGEFRILGGLGDLLSSPRRLDSIVVRDATIRIRPIPGEASPRTPPGPGGSPPPDIVIGSVSLENLTLEVAATQQGQPPRVFHIQSLRLESIDLTKSVPFEARLTPSFAKGTADTVAPPFGDLEVKGSFGPWNRSDPAFTPYQGSFLVQKADLAAFQAVEGLLDTQGSFEGTLQETRVTGEADVPNFALTGRGLPVEMKIRYTVAILDQAKRISLEEVTARFLQSALRCEGEVTDLGEDRGPAARLHISGRETQVEDFVHLADKAEQPPLTGKLDLDSDVNWPSRDGSGPLAKGRFSIPAGRFTGVGIQETLSKITRIGGGEGEGESGSSVVSNMNGEFSLADSKLSFSRLVFAVQGAKLDLNGFYDLASDSLDFQGKAQLDVAPSSLAPEKVSNWIKLVDPILAGKTGGGTSLPIRISGPRSRPLFWLDVRRLGR